MKYTLRRQQGGFAVLDMLMKLGFVLALLVIIMMVAKLIQSRVTSISSTTTLTTMAEGIRNVFGRTGSFAGLTTSAVINANIVDASMIQGGKILHEWNGYVDVTESPLSGSGSGSDGFRISYQNVPKEDCAQFVSSAEGPFARIEVNGTVAKDMPNGVPFSGVQAANGCNSGGPAVTVSFIGGRR